MTPHVARERKGAAIDGRTALHAGYAMSIHARRRIESIFWMAEEHRWPAENPIPRLGARRSPLLPRRCRLQHSGHLAIAGGLMGRTMPEIQ